MKKALLTMGNVLRGDDGAGFSLGERIDGRNGWEVFQGEDCPENQIHLIRKYDPDIVIVADAVSGIDEGDAGFIDVSGEELNMFMTHNIPVQYLIRFLNDFCEKVLFLGMGINREKCMTVETSLSASALSAVDTAERLIIELDAVLS